MEREFFDLFETATEANAYLEIEVGYIRTTDWCLFINQNNGGARKELVAFQNGNRKKIFAEGYVWLAEWLCENHGGY